MAAHRITCQNFTKFWYVFHWHTRISFCILVFPLGDWFYWNNMFPFWERWHVYIRKLWWTYLLFILIGRCYKANYKQVWIQIGCGGCCAPPSPRKFAFAPPIPWNTLSERKVWIHPCIWKLLWKSWKNYILRNCWKWNS